MIVPELAYSLADQLGIIITPELEEMLFYDCREKTVIGGWRAGKSNYLAFDFLCHIFQEQALNIPAENMGQTRRSLFWLVGPDYVQDNEEYRYLAEWGNALQITDFVSTASEGPREIRFKHNVALQTKSAAHYERLGSVAPVRIGVWEAGQIPDSVRIMLLGRAAEKRADIIYAGTLEDDEGHQQWAWYQELAKAWADDRNSEHASFSLPSWANLKVFPGGENDPEILRLKDNFDSHTFDRRIAAIPTGVQFAVYPQLTNKDGLLTEWPNNRRAIGGAGGIDFGTVHPTAAAIIQVYPDDRDTDAGFVGPLGIAVVRECWFNEDDPGDTARLQAARKELANRYKVWNWATDPNERYMARSSFATAVSGSEGAREHRIGLVTARLNLNKLFFDLNGPGIVHKITCIKPDCTGCGLFAEMSRVHRRKQSDGMLKLLRIDDDRTAALEDAIELLDGKELLRVPKPVTLRPRMARPQTGRKEFRRVG